MDLEKNKYDNVRVGINGGLDTVQAAVLLEKLDIFDNELFLREKAANYYKEFISNKHIFQYIPDSCNQLMLYFLFMIIKSLEIKFFLSSEKNIPIIVSLTSLNNQTVFKNLYKIPKQNISESISDRIFAIPFHPYIKRRSRRNSQHINRA